MRLVLQNNPGLLTVLPSSPEILGLPGRFKMSLACWGVHCINIGCADMIFGSYGLSSMQCAQTCRRDKGSESADHQWDQHCAGGLCGLGQLAQQHAACPYMLLRQGV